MNLAFIWHMHQPDYRDESGVMQMPWVFLHAIKDYYDMPWMISRHSGLKATFNITPSLILQLKLYYENPQNSDKFLNLWLQDQSSLDMQNYKWMIKICKSVPYETMAAPIESYSRLYKKESYEDGEFFDLQVLFILSWCGVYLRTNSKVVKDLLAKQRGYTYEDKLSLLEELREFISGIFDYYIELKKRDTLSLCTTPLNHPILPLLLDVQSATAANPSTNTPEYSISLKEDAVLHIQKAKDLFVKTFGFLPDGFWPAEGAVDEKSAALLYDYGAEWIATDEDILFRSISSKKRAALYTPYDYNGMCICFRDHQLSDLIGFTYRFWEAKIAVKDFISSLLLIDKTDKSATAFVILDGENAWEFYENNAFYFFDELYKSINSTAWLNTLHIEDIKKLPRKKLNKLAAGSWIGGKLDTWIGQREKNRAWELIFITKRDYEHHKESLDDALNAKITEHFLAAESSDWFWWYGDDHYTEFGLEYDALFRSHLICIYNLMQIEPPFDFFEPIIQKRSSKDFWIYPQSHISPHINGKNDSFFDWIGCGVVYESKFYATMDRKRGPIKKMLYGQDFENIYFAFEADMDEIKNFDFTLRTIIDPIGFDEEVSFDFEGKKEYKSKKSAIAYEVAYEDWVEIKIAKNAIKKQKLYFRFELSKDDMVIQVLPGFGMLEIDTQSDFSDRWFV
jgi:alpha-amylase/alpha-mannosidase (GH57 family)